jgi:hypothetical protein
MAAEEVCEIDQATGLPKRSAHGSASDAYRRLAMDARVQNDLDEVMKTLRGLGIWIWRLGTIEDHLGILQKDTKAWSTICGAVAADGLDRAVADPAVFRELAVWLEN